MGIHSGSRISNRRLANSIGGAPTKYFGHFLKKIASKCKKKDGGGGVLGSPLGSANDSAKVESSGFILIALCDVMTALPITELDS